MDLNVAIQTLKRLKTEEVRIRFRKKNNELRIMRCTLDFTKIPASKKPKGINLENILGQIRVGNLRVFDLDKQEWRTIPLNSIEYIS